MKSENKENERKSKRITNLGGRDGCKLERRDKLKYNGKNYDGNETWKKE